VTALKIVFYPSTSSFSGTGQLALGPFNVGTVNKLLQVELRGAANFDAATITATGVLANVAIYGIQWVAHGAGHGDVVSSAYDPTWPIRHQLGMNDLTASWTPTTGGSNTLACNALWGHWAGQLAIGENVDMWLLLKSPSGQAVSNMNLFASLEAWWV
jgi:hypothetical protein